LFQIFRDAGSKYFCLYYISLLIVLFATNMLVFPLIDNYIFFVITWESMII
ncbi:hypothetical protein BgiBS90_021035, partial [Biomphalaria glabrata]